MTKYFKYLRYVLRHKWYVFLECCKAGIIWRGIVHDLSKFIPHEMIPYARHFYGDNKNSSDTKLEKAEGYFKDRSDPNDPFDFAWLRHQRKYSNRHHWQFWVLKEDNGSIVVLEIPLNIRKEMICDWIGAGRAQGLKNNTKEWYLRNRANMVLGPETRKWVERELGI